MNRFTSGCFGSNTKSDIDSYYYFRSGHVTEFDFQMRYLDEFRLYFAPSGGMDSPYHLLSV